jgi:ubiquinone/menaquinone biosynthesis C-methylase UbiE
VDPGGSGVTKATTDPAYWNDLAARYEAMAAPFTGHFARAALAGLEIRSGTQLLDVATGTGALALAAAEQGAVVTAIDFAPAMVMRVAAHAHPRVTALQMDGQALDLPDDAFDVVASVFGVMLFPDWRAGLAEMARVCRPGGRVVVVVWSDPEGAAIFQWLADIRRQLFPADLRPEPAIGMTVMAEPERLAEAMVTAGFEAPIVRAEAHAFQLELRLLDDPETAFSGMPLWTTLTTVQKRAVRAEMMRRVVAAGVKNVFPITSTALIATAQLPG